MGPVEGDADIYDTNCQTRSGLCNNFPILWMLLTQRYDTNNTNKTNNTIIFCGCC